MRDKGQTGLVLRGVAWVVDQYRRIKGWMLDLVGPEPITGAETSLRS